MLRHAMIMAFRCEIWFMMHGFDKKRLGILGSNLGALHVPFFFFFELYLKDYWEFGS